MVVGCHNTHCSVALRQIGGLPAHDAEDVLITMLYRASGWRGVYFPEIIARGLAPVDWDGYLAQQRRWARSFLDLELRIFPALSERLPLRARVLNLLHGLGYLHRSLLFLIGIIGFGFMLISGEALKPLVWGSAVPFGIMLVSLQICEFYRQRFYLDWRNEWGLHWRSGLLQYAKWPYFLLAFYDVMLGKPVPYVLTRKVKGNSCRHLCWPHLLVIVFIVCCWTIGVASGRLLDPFLHVCAASITVITAGIVLSNRLNFPAPYDTELADTN
jgi:cellulose synthase (UDP-forming)